MVCYSLMHDGSPTVDGKLPADNACREKLWSNSAPSRCPAGRVPPTVGQFCIGGNTALGLIQRPQSLLLAECLLRHLRVLLVRPRAPSQIRFLNLAVAYFSAFGSIT